MRRRLGLAGGAPFRSALGALALAMAAAAPAWADCGGDWRDGPSAGLIDGTGAFPLGVWLQDPRHARSYRDIGVNLYIGQWKGPTRPQLEALRAADMPVFGLPTEAARDPAFADVVAGWLLPDEPDNAQRLADRSGYGPPIPPGDVRALHCAAAAVEPFRPVLLQLGMGVAWEAWRGRGGRIGRMEDYPDYVRAGHIVSFDIYPVTSMVPGVGGRIELVGRGAERLRTWAPAKPAWVSIGISGLNNPSVRPSPAEMRAQIWMALIHGARGLIYVTHQFKPTFDAAAILSDVDGKAALTAENARIQRLAPVLFQPTLPDDVATPASDGLKVMAKDHGGNRYVFAISLTGAHKRAGVRLDGAPAQVEVVDEGRTAPVVDGVLTDDFAPYQPHIYRFAR